MDMTTDYLGLTLKHPFMPGASPMANHMDKVRRLEDAGASAITIYSLFEEQIIHEQLAANRAEFGDNSFAESLSYLPTPDDFRLGPHEYIDHVARVKQAVDVPVIASLNGTSPGGWVDYAKQIQQAGADALELNTYELAHSLEESSQQIEQRIVDLVHLVKQTVTIPIAVKLLPVYSGLPMFATRLAEVGADGLVLFNRIYQPTIDLEELDMQSTHALSQPGELGVRLRWLGILSPRTSMSLACSGGVHSAEAAIRALMSGADVVQIVSALLRHGPEYLAAIIKRFADWSAENEYNRLADLRGSMNVVRCPDPRAYTRASYIQTLQVWD